MTITYMIRVRVTVPNLRIDKGSPRSAVHSGTCSHNCYHYDGILYIFGKAIFSSIHRYHFYFNRLEIIGFMNLRLIFFTFSF